MSLAKQVLNKISSIQESRRINEDDKEDTLKELSKQTGIDIGVLRLIQGKSVEEIKKMLMDKKD